MPSALHEFARQLKTLFVPRLELMDLQRVIVEDFFGDSLDNRWAATIPAGAAVAVQNTPPSYLRISTGATINSGTSLNEGAFDHWTVSYRLTVRMLCAITNTASVRHIPILLNDSVSERILIEYDTSVGDAGWRLRTLSGGSTTTSAVMLAANTSFNKFDLSIQTGSVKARMNNGPVVESTANIPAGSLSFVTFIENLVAADRISDIDLIMFWPGKAMF